MIRLLPCQTDTKSRYACFTLVVTRCPRVTCVLPESGTRHAFMEERGRGAPAVAVSSGEGRRMTTAVMTVSEPVGIVIRDRDDARRTPRILMWFWASEEEANDEEEWRERM